MEKFLFDWAFGNNSDQIELIKRRSNSVEESNEKDIKLKYIQKRIDHSLCSKMRKRVKLQLGHCSPNCYLEIFKGECIGKQKIIKRRIKREDSYENHTIILNILTESRESPFLFTKEISSIKKFEKRNFSIEEVIKLKISSLQFKYFIELETLELLIVVDRSKTTSLINI